MRGLLVLARTYSIPLFLGCVFASAGGASCLDLRNIQEVEFRGRLEFVVFPGSPNFADVRKDDSPEPTYILQLSDPICITGDDSADPNRMFSTIHLMPSDATEGALRSLVGADVYVTLKDPMAANTGHHHAPLVAWVEGVWKAADKSAEYGAATTTVRGFYDALAAGSGDQASAFIVPERRSGPFAPAAMTAFYGGLLERLRVISVEPTGLNAFLVRYQFRSRAGRCNGRAIVSTVSRGGANYITSIRALDGC
jgi:hypothetical protein